MRVRPSLVALSSLFVVAAGTVGVSASAAPPGPSFTVRPGTTQLEVLDATAGEHLELLDSSSTQVATGVVDSLGSLVWRQLDPGSYTVHELDPPGATSAPAQVTAFDAPAPGQGFYKSQTLSNGFGYITTRDGTTLSANVVLPQNQGPGPFPTVVEYSGYDPSNPANTGFSSIFTNMGYAYVGVNIRGTGCSGGSFLPFEPVQSLDGYDAIETIAAQSWVANHKVGMVGISYPGISQLYVARTEPPHLAAITPLSVIDDTYRGTLYPGGILNTGFAVPWANDRAAQAQPYGQPWTKDRADGGDTECAANQDVRLQNPDPLQLIETHNFYDDTYYAQIDPTKFAPRINVPVFIAGAWQDEQTGGHFPDFLDQFTGSPHVYATMSNGSHTESIGLGTFGRLADFLDIYVARRKPTGIAAFIAPVIVNTIMKIPGTSLPKGLDYTGLDYAGAKQLFESQKPVRIGFEEGARKGEPSGAPAPRFVRSFKSWPIPSAEPRTFYLSNKGGLRGHKPTHGPSYAPARSFAADPSALPATDYTGSSSAIWGAHPAYDWRQIPKGKGLGFISHPLTKKLVAIGTGSADLWVKSPASDVDLEVTLSEVRPDGTEVYVQSGWLRASHRKLEAARTTNVRPVHTDLESDAKPLPADQWRKVRVEIFPFAHPFRPGSRIRLTVDAPGGARPLWAFANTIDDGQQVSISANRLRVSKLVLSQVPGVKIPAKAPACADLRSQPCRHYPR